MMNSRGWIARVIKASRRRLLPTPSLVSFPTDARFMGLQTTPEQQLANVRERYLARDGRLLPRNRPLNVFAAFHNFNWESANLLPALQTLGSVTHYDWVITHEVDDPDWYRGPRAQFNAELLDRVRRCHREKKVDVFFSYLIGPWVQAETLEQIRGEGIFTMNLSLDDEDKFWGIRVPSGYSGIADIAGRYDACLTSAASAIPKYLSVNAAPVFTPEGADPDFFKPLAVCEDKDIPVSFIGQKYGARGDMIARVERAGIPVAAFGNRWPRGRISTEEMASIYARSLVCLGHGLSAQGKVLALKGRDFEVPMSGTCYLTLYNPELIQYFVPNEEILFYNDFQELVDILKSLLAKPEKAIAIGRAARARSLKDHTWTRRLAAPIQAVSDSAANPN